MSDPLPANCLVLSKVGRPAVAAMFKEAMPNDEIKVKLTNGISSLELVFRIDENLPDRVSGQLHDESEDDLDETKPGDEPAAANMRAMPGDGVGASVMAVMGRPK